MTRRGFLVSLAAPLLVRPTLEDIERLTWRHRLFPAHPARIDVAFSSQELMLSIENLSERVLAPQILHLANQIDRMQLLTLHLRKTQPFAA